MKDTIIKETIMGDVADLQLVLDATELFPSAYLQDLLKRATEEGALWLSCHVDEHAIGFCYSVPEEMTQGTWNLRALAVLPARQGAGLGTQLVQQTEQRLASTNQRLLIIDTSGGAEFAATRSFYAKLGYEPEARIRDFWAEGDDKVTFTKKL